MNKTEKLKRLENYPHAYLTDYEFESEMVKVRQQVIIDIMSFHKPSVVVEIGCGVDHLYSKAVEAAMGIEQWIIVEPLTKFVEMTKNIKQKTIELHIIHDFFEDAAESIQKLIRRPIDFIVCAGLLHEVPNPDKLLETARQLLDKNGIFHINVPNAESLHRRLAKAMNLIADLKEFSERNRKLLQHRIFDMTSLQSLLTTHGFSIESSGGYFVKPFSNKQMSQIRNILSPEVLAGLLRLGQEMPQMANEIYVNVKAKQ